MMFDVEFDRLSSVALYSSLRIVCCLGRGNWGNAPSNFGCREHDCTYCKTFSRLLQRIIPLSNGVIVFDPLIYAFQQISLLKLLR